jgi:hypothetical protein
MRKEAKFLELYRKCNQSERFQTKRCEQSETKRNLFLICFANSSENPAKRVAFRFHFAWNRKKIKA